MNCTEAVSALVASLEGSGTITDEQREHIRTCERCRELLDSAKQFQTMLSGEDVSDVTVHTVAAVAEQEVARARRRGLIIRVLAVLLGLATLFWLMVPAGMLLGFDRVSESAMVVAMVVSIAILVAAPVLLIIVTVRAAVNPASGKRVYKRLGPGRMVSGVCLGLSERSGISVGWLRVGFVLLMMFDGVGLLLYILLDLFMPVHPDDRQYLLRFKLRRMMARLRA
jgi:phage shock protein C